VCCVSTVFRAKGTVATHTFGLAKIDLYCKHQGRQHKKSPKSLGQNARPCRRFIPEQHPRVNSSVTK
jgi:hypothetical protein